MKAAAARSLQTEQAAVIDGSSFSLPASPVAMFAPIRVRSASFLLLAALTVALTGCDSDDYREEPRDRTAVQQFTVDFVLGEASFEGPFASTSYDAPEITPEVVDDGLVMAYVREADTWTALPYTYGVEFPEDQNTGDEAAVDYTVTLGFSYEVGFFEVFYELSDYDDYVWDQLEELGPRLVKVVVFSEETVQRNQSLDFKDYGAVQQHFHLDS